MAFREVREYQPGDDIRTIDWNVTARMSDAYVKVFVEERELTVMLVVDVSALRARSARARTPKREIAAEVAALLAFSAIKNNDRVGLFLFTDRVEKVVPPRKGGKHVLRLVSDILSFQPQGKGTDLSLALGSEFLSGGPAPPHGRARLRLVSHISSAQEPSRPRLTRVTKRRTVLFVVSDFLLEAYEAPLRTARMKHDVVPVVLRDPMEEAFPALGLVQVEDPETGERAVVDTSSPVVRRAFHAAVARHPRRANADLPQARARLGGAPRRRGPRRGAGTLLPRPRPEARRVRTPSLLLVLGQLAAAAPGAQPVPSRAGADAGVEVERTVQPLAVDRQVTPEKVRLGEPFVYRITIHHPAAQRWELRTPRELGGYELIAQSRTRSDGKGESSTTYLLRMSLFALGSHVLPTLTFDVVEPQGGGVARIDGPDIEAKSSLRKDADQLGAKLEDIKPNEDVPVRSWRLLWWVAGARRGRHARLVRPPRVADQAEAACPGRAAAVARGAHAGSARRARVRRLAPARAAARVPLPAERARPRVPRRALRIRRARVHERRAAPRGGPPGAPGGGRARAAAVRGPV